VGLNIGRRRLLKYGALLSIGAGAAYLGYAYLPKYDQNTTSTLSSIRTSVADSSTHGQFLEWLASVSKPYSGRSLSVALEAEASTFALQSIDNDFFNVTGINAQFNIKPYLYHLADIQFMAATASPSYDAFDADYQDIASFKDHVLSPTDLADKYPDLTYSQFTQNDFQDEAWALTANYPPPTSGAAPSQSNKTLFIPFVMDVMIRYYRKDSFESAGIAALPVTWDDYYSAVKAVDKTTLTQFGTVNQAGTYVSVVFEFLNHLSSFGGKLWNYDGQRLTSALDSPEALAALENFVRFKPYSDPASPYYTWDDVINDIDHGYAATAIEFDSFDYFVQSPYRSTVVGKVGYLQNPSGPKGSFSTFGGSGIGISRYAKNPEAAWLWLQWATSVGVQETIFLSPFHGYPSRKAVFDEPQVKQALSKDEHSAQRVAKSVWDSNQVTSLLTFPKWLKVLDPLDLHLSNAMSGVETPQIALAAAQEKIAKLGDLTF
jgi:multiple sugar transport system substrate-binding protein